MAGYRYEGIGKASALVIFAWLGASSFSVFTTGPLGRFTFYILEQFCTYLAGRGIVLLNITVADIQIVGQKKDFDGSFAEAFKEIHGNPKRLTPEQKKAVDEKVMRAFRRFADFGGAS